MGKTRTPYPAEFRAQMVELVKAGRTPQELAREFEPTAQTIINWAAQADRDAGVRHDGLTTGERQELTRLRRKCASLRWNSLTRASFSQRARSSREYSGLASPGPTWLVITLDCCATFRHSPCIKFVDLHFT
ncbi:hypothetical protein CUJ88_45530 (plasmid) [Paraburkholderia hospita]|nr:hypothetical protein CUJ88_45530 [Paraburkholderia hospita]